VPLGLAALAHPATAPAQEVEGFRSVLAQGQGTTAPAGDVAAHVATGAVPPAFTNQQPLYAGLGDADVWANLTEPDLDTYFKDADFGVLPGGEASRAVPRPGVTIVRDARFAVPRITGATREDVMFGSGYAQAQDRLFLMDVLRRTARGSLSELVGPSGAAGDAQTLTQQDFSAEELQAQIDTLDDRHGPEGAQVQRDLAAYVDGINQFIEEVRRDPLRQPGEYAALGTAPAPWTVVDTAAQATFLVSAFNVAGIGERQNAIVLEALRRRLGPRRARRVFDDLRRLDDPDSPVTADHRFRDHRPGRPDRRASALLDKGSIEPRDALVGTAPAPGSVPPFVASLLGIPQQMPRTKSNAVLVSGRLSQSGRPLASMGPQVGYFSPQIFSEVELQGGGIDVSGVVFPGAAPYVLIGHTKRFAWSGTSPMSDNADVFAERLCDPGGGRVGDPAAATHYRHRGACRPFVSREQVLTTPASPTSPDSTPQRITLRTLRSVHGPVTHFARVGGVPVALAQSKTVDFREVDAALAFARLASGQVTDFASFRRAWRDYPGGENWYFVSEREMGFQLSGPTPIRARGVDPDLPTWGTGEWDWRGTLPFARLPWAREPAKGYIVNWNGKEAPGWRAPSEVWSLGPTQRGLLLERRLKAELRRAGGKIDLAGLVRTTEAAAFADIEGQELLPLARAVLRRTRDAEVRALLELLEAWRRRGAERRYAEPGGQVADAAAVALMQAWTPALARGIFEPVLGAEAVDQIDKQLMALAPDTTEFDGWHGQVAKDLRQVLRRRGARGRLSRTYCGGGRLARCRSVLAGTLRQAAARLRAQFGGGPETWRAPVEQTEITTAGAIATPPFPFQNRGTYHQAVELRPKR
jgi:acyl-homoserine lactone acylase PvdQ